MTDLDDRIADLVEDRTADAPPGVRREVSHERTADLWSRARRRTLRHALYRIRELRRVEVVLDPESGELRSLEAPSSVQDGRSKALPDDELVDRAREVVDLPDDAELEGVTRRDDPRGNRLARVTWTHVHEGLPVEGDRVVCSLHPLTGRVAGLHREWNEVVRPIPAHSDPVPEEEVGGLARKAIEDMVESEEATATTGARRAWVRVSWRPESSEPWELFPAWVARIRDRHEAEDVPFEHEVALHLFTGEVIRYDRIQ